jgi:hypothetical protein
MGRDPAVTPDELTKLVDRGAVRFFLVQDRERMREMMEERMSGAASTGDEASPGGAPQGPAPGGPPGSENEAVSWVQDSCEKVPQELWQSSDVDDDGGRNPGGPERAQALYDCAEMRGR